MKYKVYGVVVGGTFIGEFEADSPTDALGKAWDSAYVSFCHQCSDHCEDPEVETLTAHWTDENGEDCTLEENNNPFKHRLDKAVEQIDELKSEIKSIKDERLMLTDLQEMLLSKLGDDPIPKLLGILGKLDDC